MRHIYWLRSRQGRLLVILLAALVYFCLLAFDADNFFPHYLAIRGEYWLEWLQFGFSAFVSLMFLAVGAPVWVYARDRRVATMLFLFCLTLMLTFAVETDAALNDALPLLSIIGSVAGILALYVFALLVLVFPKDTLSLIGVSDRAGRRGERSNITRRQIFNFTLRTYLVILTLLCMVSVADEALYYILPSQFINALATVKTIYTLLALSGSLTAIIITYLHTSSRRERQQPRLFAGGTIMAVAPFLFLTVIPEVFGGVFPFAVDPQISTITLALLPLVLGYSILRYQLLVFDRHIRVAVAWLVGVVCLVVLAYSVFTVSSLLYTNNLLASTALAVVLMGLLAPWVWWFARTVTEKLFFSEIRHFRSQLDRSATDMLAGETLDLNAAARLLTLAVIDAFATQEVCLYVLDEDTGYYRLSPLLREHEPDDIIRRTLAQRLYRNLNAAQQVNTEILNADAPIIQRMHAATRPLSLSEASEETLPTGLARYLTTTSPPMGGTEPILSPVRARGKLIAVLVLGERGDGQQYAGPDFEVLSLLFARFAPVLETARLYERSNRHTAILNTLYSASTMDLSSYCSVEEVAGAYAKIVAEAVMAGAEIWLYGKDTQLRCVTHQGTGPQLTCEDNLLLAHIQDWTPRFCEGESVRPRQQDTTLGPTRTEWLPRFPYAWLPLQKGQQKIGTLVLTYLRPHLFSHEEKRVLEMFAVQCADALENTRMTIALRAAYARQQELDQLKDQFIATASHELRTPLTAVQGYIELLAAYDGGLEPEVRADFIAKANRGCDELNLMVGNIMDASHVQIDAENVQLSQLSLAESVRYVLEILEAITHHENRLIAVDIPADLSVMADQMRLRQVLLNLVSNALKYSPPGSPIEISADGDARQATLRVRDYGAGVPLEDQERLFERFVRLERDINSTVRGAGLGLYISKQLIEAMHGQIRLMSSGVPYEGSTFSFILQRSPAAQDAAGRAGRQRVS